MVPDADGRQKLPALGASVCRCHTNMKGKQLRVSQKERELLEVAADQSLTNLSDSFAARP